MLIDFCTHNELRINNTFFEHKHQHKVSFCGSKVNSTTDYIITNRNIRPEQITDVRALTSANIGSDRNLILGKVTMMKPPPKKHSQLANQEKFNIESFRNQSTIDLYQRRLKQNLDNNIIIHDESPDIMWEKLKTNITNAAKEAIGIRILKKIKQ
ncbi:hypothetical protein RN001_011358 [Aquatica leii]|uniref:Uncharacterized protein n=1 Tax=Aquatica leii TaxID=1421715 RepID=A0AAN7SEZ0_9COLE|nr:hypothetical protein RN001_011358 [Aquatica leii]